MTDVSHAAAEKAPQPDRARVEPQRDAHGASPKVLTQRSMLHLQRAAGNAAAGQLITDRGRSPRHVTGPGQRPPTRPARTPPQPARRPGVQREATPQSARAANDVSSGNYTVQRLGIGDVLEHVPGYDMLTLIVGADPFSGEEVVRSPAAVIEAIFGLLPGGAAVYDEIARLGVVQDVFATVDQELGSHHLTLERLERTIDQAWEEVEIIEGIDHNIGVVTRHVNALKRDATSFADSMTDTVVDLIKSAAIDEAERLLSESESANAAWDLTTSVLRKDPLRGEQVEATTEQVIEKFLILIGRDEELAQMKANNTLEPTAAWLDEQLATFDGIITDFAALVSDALDALSIAELPDLATNLTSLSERGLAMIGRVVDFAAVVATKVLELIKESMVGALDAHAQSIPGYHLLTVILEQNPFTGATVPRTAESLIKGFITLAPGGEQQYNELSETGVIPRAAARIESAIGELGISWEFIEGLFVDIWNSFTIDDLLAPMEAFERVVSKFEEPIGRLFEFVGTVAEEVVTLVLKLMGFPSELLGRIVDNVVAAFDDIVDNPVGFLTNLLKVIELGLNSFFANIGTHVTGGLADWLLGGLKDAGIEVPDELTLESILDVVFQVLDVSTETLWEKLGERIGPEKVEQIRGAVDQLSGVWQFVADVQERGLAAVWDYLGEKVSAIWDSILGTAQDWILTELIEAAAMKLLSMLDPTGVMAVVNSVQAFIRAIQSVTEYLHEILEVIDRYVATIASIAAGDLGPGAQRLESGLAQSIPVAIGFLANQVGLGDIAGKIAEIIEGIRELADQALDWLLDQAIALGTSVLNGFGIVGTDEANADPESTADEDVDVADHDAVVARVVAELEAVVADETYEGTRAAMETRARSFESHYSPKLPEGVNLTVSFADAATDSEDQDIDFGVLIAPNNSEGGGKNAVDDKPGHATADGTKAGAPLAGRVGTYSANGGQDPRSSDSKHPELRLIAEHIVPRAQIEPLLEALEGPGVPRTGSDYNKTQTVKIYQAAADVKTASDGELGAEHSAVNAIRANNVYDDGTPATEGKEVGLLAGLRDALLRRLSRAVADRKSATIDAVADEARGQAAQQRGTLGDQVPDANKIETVATHQHEGVSELLQEAHNRLKATYADGRTPGLQDDASFIAQFYGGSRTESGEGFRLRIPLGAEGGTGHRGPATVTLQPPASSAGSGGIIWRLEVGSKVLLEAGEAGGTYQRSESGPEHIMTILSTIRSGERDIEPGANTSEYPQQVRRDAVAAFATHRTQEVSDAAAARAAIADLNLSDDERTPVASSVIRWARAAGIASTAQENSSD